MRFVTAWPVGRMWVKQVSVVSSLSCVMWLLFVYSSFLSRFFQRKWKQRWSWKQLIGSWSRYVLLLSSSCQLRWAICPPFSSSHSSFLSCCWAFCPHGKADCIATGCFDHFMYYEVPQLVHLFGKCVRCSKCPQPSLIFSTQFRFW